MATIVDRQLFIAESNTRQAIAMKCVKINYK